MSRIIKQTIALLAIAALGLVAMFASAPQAEAQYGAEPPGGILIFFTGGANGGGTITAGQGPYNVTYVVTANTGETINLGTFVVANQGNFTPPAGFLDGLPAGTHTVTATVVDITGATSTNTFKLTVKARAGVPVAVPVAKPVAKPIAQPNLAFTGNEVSLPITAGAILIGSGGLLLLAANKRNRRV